MNNSFIQINNISKHFADVKAVDDVSFEIKEGEFFSLLGPSGCGKTTLLRLLAGFEYPTSGNLLIDGMDITALPPDKRPTNMVFQNYAIFPHLNVSENVGYGLRNTNFSKDEISKKIDDALKLVGLKGLNKRASSALSGGQRQRVALARALILKPRVLLLDEPLSALDKNLREQMQFELRQLQKSVGITFILVTHDQTEALTMSDRVGVMFNGRVDQVATPEQIYNKPETKKVAAFIGSMNFFETKCLEKSSKTVTVFHKDLGNVKLLKNNIFGVDSTKLTIGIRPENLKIISGNLKIQSKFFTAKIVEKSFMGDTMLYSIKLNQSENNNTYNISVSDIKNSPNPNIGDKISVTFEEDDVVAYFEE